MIDMIRILFVCHGTTEWLPAFRNIMGQNGASYGCDKKIDYQKATVRHS